MYYTRSQCHTLHTLLIRAPRFTTKKTLITPNDNRIKSSSPDLSFKSFIRGGIYKQTVDWNHQTFNGEIKIIEKRFTKKRKISQWVFSSLIGSCIIRPRSYIFSTEISALLSLGHCLFCFVFVFVFLSPFFSHYRTWSLPCGQSLLSRFHFPDLSGKDRSDSASRVPGPRLCVK